MTEREKTKKVSIGFRVKKVSMEGTYPLYPLDDDKGYKRLPVLFINGYTRSKRSLRVFCTVFTGNDISKYFGTLY